MNNPRADEWRPMTTLNPSTRLRIARSIPRWVLDQQRDAKRLDKEPPKPPKMQPSSVTGNHGDPDYEVIEIPLRPQNHESSSRNVVPDYRTNKVNTSTTSMPRKCALCGTDNVSMWCKSCAENYCNACDKINHKHPKREHHSRQQISKNIVDRFEPLLPPKRENMLNLPPIPPPRRHRRNSQVKAISKQGDEENSLSDKRKSFERKIVNDSRPLPSIPTSTLMNSHLKPPFNTNITKAASIASTDKMSTLQERYRRYQEAMRAQDSNRRRPPPSDPSRDTLTCKSIGTENSEHISISPSSLPARKIVQSASVCDLSASTTWNPEIQQAQSLAHLAAPMFWCPWNNPLEPASGGSTMSLNHTSMWAYPMGFKQAQISPFQYPRGYSRPYSPTRSTKSTRGSKAISPSLSLKSRESTASRLMLRRLPSSPSDASSEDSDESGFDDRMTRGLRRKRYDSYSRSKPKDYLDEYKNRSLLLRHKGWRSENRINNIDRNGLKNMTKHDCDSPRNSEDPNRSLKSKQKYDHKDLSKYTQSFSAQENESSSNTRESSRQCINRLQDHMQQDLSTDDDLSDRSVFSDQRSKIATPAVGRMDYYDREFVPNVAREVDKCTDARRQSVQRKQQANVDEIQSHQYPRNSGSIKKAASIEWKLIHPKRYITEKENEATQGRSRRSHTPESRNRRCGSHTSNRRTIAKEASRSLSPENDTCQEKVLRLNTPDDEGSQTSIRSLETQKVEFLPEMLSESIDRNKSITPRQTPDTRKQVVEGIIEQSFPETVIPSDIKSPSTGMAGEWACEHCTLINDPEDRICIICCKTRSSVLSLLCSSSDRRKTATSSEPQVITTPSEPNADTNTDMENKLHSLRLPISEESDDSGSTKKKAILRLSHKESRKT